MYGSISMHSMTTFGDSFNELQFGKCGKISEIGALHVHFKATQKWVCKQRGGNGLLYEPSDDSLVPSEIIACCSE